MKLFSKAKDLFDFGKMEIIKRKAMNLEDLVEMNLEDLEEMNLERVKEDMDMDLEKGRYEKRKNEKKKAMDLLYHVQRGDLDCIKRADPEIIEEARDKEGNTVLMIATKKGNLDLCKEILKKCPSLLYHGNDNRQTVLHQAIDSVSSHEIYFFIDYFVCVSLETHDVDQIHTEKYKRFINKQDLKGDTALFKAVDLGNLLVVKRFLEVDRQYDLGLGPYIFAALKLAVKKNNHEMVKLLTDEGDLYCDFIPYSTAMDLFDCIKRGDLDYIKTVELNVLLNFRDQYGMSVLCIATKWDQLDCCKEILKSCPSLLYHQNNDNWSVLHHAAGNKNGRLIDFFVSAGLEAAKSEGDTEMISFKKWINLQNKSGDTPLVIAVISRSIDIVKWFADLDRHYKLGLSGIGGSNKKTALQWAVHIECIEMIKTLIDDGNFPIPIAIEEAQESLQTGNSSGTGVVSENNIFTFAELSKHNNLKDCWLLINDKVYDVTKFLGDHPGGSEVLLKATGKDATTDFQKAHSHSRNAVTMMDKFYVGVYDSITSSLSKLASDKPQPYSQVQIKEFTKDFSQPIGSGGFGVVYRGQFANGVLIAVKVLKNIEFNEKVMKEQFVAEVDTMGRAYHCNLIKLYGYCYEANTKFKALVYDYMENGSFDTILFEKKLDLPWVKLHNIAKEIAQGISYLHESCKPQIIHQDLKPSNVLLDSNLSPKVIDFGLAKVNTEESQFDQTNVKGSRDYMAPEVNQPEQVKLSCKIDVYSFGKMLFDILGSKRNCVDKSGFSGQVWENYKTDQLDEFILDCGIIKEEDKEIAKRLAIIALLCVEHNPQARPMLSNVVKMLEGKIKLDTPVAPFYPNYCSSESSSMSDSRDC